MTDTPIAQPRVKPLDLSNLLKHAFMAGRASVGGASSFSNAAWVEYDPEPNPAWFRILAALEPTPVTVHVAVSAIRVDLWGGKLHQTLVQERVVYSWQDAFKIVEEGCEAGLLANVIHTDFVDGISLAQETPQ